MRLFLINDVERLRQTKVEAEAARIMAEVTSDDEWMSAQAVKVLTVEHHMAARRGGFDGFFEPLYKA